MPCFSYYPEIFNESGSWALVDKFGDWFTYDRSPRAKIFRRDHHLIKDIDSMTRMMRLALPFALPGTRH